MNDKSPGDFGILSVRVTVGFVLAVLTIFFIYIYYRFPAQKDLITFAAAVTGGAATVYSAYFASAALRLTARLTRNGNIFDLLKDLEWVLAFGSQGIGVFPLYGVTDAVCHCPVGSECRSPGKHPIPALVPRGVKNATTDPAVIRRWFRKEPHANLAWAMGGALRLLGVDVDPRSGGDASLCDLVEAHGDEWLNTFIVKTGSLGNHFIYRLPEGVEFRRGKLAPGIDLKYEGGYLVAPPSTHASGRRYEVEKNAYIAEAPAWLVEELTRGADEPPVKVVDFQERRNGRKAGGPAIVEGERNERLFRVGCALWGKREVASRAELLQRMMETNFERVSPPLEPPEVHKIVESIAGRYPIGMPIREVTS